MYLSFNLYFPGHWVIWGRGFPCGSDGKECACNEGDLCSIPESGRSPGEGMATHSSILAWRIPWTEKHCGLQPMGSHIVGHNWATNTHNLRELLFLGTTIWYVSGAASLKKIWQYIPNRGYTCYYPTIPFLVVKHTEKLAGINKKACTRMSIIAFIQIYIYDFNKRMTKYKHLIISRREPRL